MNALTSEQITAVISAVTGPISDNFVAILTILATVAGISLVVKYFKKAAK